MPLLKTPGRNVNKKRKWLIGNIAFFLKLAQSIVTYIQNISISRLKQKANRRKKQDLFLKFENS